MFCCCSVLNEFNLPCIIIVYDERKWRRIVYTQSPYEPESKPEWRKWDKRGRECRVEQEHVMFRQTAANFWQRRLSVHKILIYFDANHPKIKTWSQILHFWTEIFRQENFPTIFRQAKIGAGPLTRPIIPPSSYCHDVAGCRTRDITVFRDVRTS